MKITSKNKSCYERVLSKIDVKRFCTNNQQKCSDCLEPKSNKNEHDCKKCGCNEFYVPSY